MKESHTEYTNVLSNIREMEKYEQLSMFECGEDVIQK